MSSQVTFIYKALFALFFKAALQLNYRNRLFRLYNSIGIKLLSG